MQIQANAKEEIYDCCQCRWILKAATFTMFSALSSEGIFINLILFYLNLIILFCKQNLF